MSPAKLNHDAYTVGWVCVLPCELNASRVLLDEEHEKLSSGPKDGNKYLLGRMGRHNVVIAFSSEYGVKAAARTATTMVLTFRNIRFGLLVGVGGGAPKPPDPKEPLNDIRLGDVVVSFPKGKSDHDLEKGEMKRYIDDVVEKSTKLGALKHYRFPGRNHDQLFKTNSPHTGREGCLDCDAEELVRRLDRESDEPVVHHGTIASGSADMRSAQRRDELRDAWNIRCFEMEAAGLIDDFPCTVIRGICDYSDDHKHRLWQPYAAVVAASYAKDLLRRILPEEVGTTEAAVKVIKQFADSLSTVETTVSRMSTTMDDNQKEKILNWLTPVDYGPQQSDHFSRQQEGTGQWLLVSHEFRKWLNERKQTLYCDGIPGAGKTIMTSIVVEHLNNRHRNDISTSIVYLYCDFRRQQKPFDLLTSLLKQLAWQHSHLPEDMKNLYNYHRKGQSRPSFCQISQLLQTFMAEYQRVFIIIDAIDECPVSNGDRVKFLSEIFRLQAETGANVFATSRVNNDIKKLFEGALSLEIRARVEDIQKYINAQTETLQPDIFDNSMRHKIGREIIEAADGMFLLARLHMEKITNLHTRGHINLALHNLAKETDGLDETYKQAMDRIENQGDELRALAKQILAWIIHAKRPLSITELRHAVAVRPNAVKVDIEFLPSDQTLRSVCEGLVTVDEKSNIVRLVHYTTEEFFKRTWQSWFHSAQTDIANVCIGYLSFHTFETGYCETDEEFKSRLQENSLYAYSSQNWGYHVSGTAMERESLVLDLLMSKNKLDSSTQAMLAPTYGSQDSFYEQTVPRQMTAVHVAAYFGLVGALIELFKVGHEPDSRDTYQRTPLSWAAKNCHKPAVELLLATAGVNVNSQDQNGQTPLMEAAFQGDGTVVELLLGAEGIEVNSKDNDGLTPLLVATRDGHKGVVKLLLGKGANPESKDKYGQTPLYIAAVRGHEGVVKLLLEEGADPESKDEYGQTPLLAAIIQGNVAVVELLLGTEGVDMNSRDNIGLTPLRAATMKGDERVVRLLFEKWLYPD